MIHRSKKAWTKLSSRLAQVFRDRVRDGVEALGDLWATATINPRHASAGISAQRRHLLSASFAFPIGILADLSADHSN